MSFKVSGVSQASHTASFATATVQVTKSSQSEQTSPSISSNPAPAPMSWKMRGDYHLERKELDLALESFTKALQESEIQKNTAQIADSLKDLGRVFLAKEQWPLAAKILNGSYALDSSKQTTLALMAEVERLFLKQVCGVTARPKADVYLQRRQTLKALREAEKAQLQKSDETPTILMTFSQSIASLLQEILESGYKLIGKPPCKYTLLGLGSLARKEMSPYSDLEFALLIEKSSPNKLAYFRNLVQWLELQVIHLGETAIKILDGGFESPVVRGFSFDDGGNTPLGKAGYVELIKTPEELAQFQSERFYQEDLILSNVLRGADLVVGSETLYKKYTEAVQKLLTAPAVKASHPICEERALNLLQGHLVEFEPRLDRKKEETPIYNIKVELYRLPSFLIAGLADYFGIGEQNTWKKLEELFKRKILSAEGLAHLQKAMAATMNLRIRCHLHYGRECEDVYHPKMQLKIPGKQKQNLFVLSDADLDQIVEVYRVIFPLHRIFKQLCQTRNFAELSKESFYDDGFLAQAEAYKNLHQHDKAKECYQRALALNPDDTEVMLKLARLLDELAEYPEAQQQVDKALDLGKRQNDQSVISRALYLQGLLCDALGAAKKAVEYYEESLKIGKKVYGDEEHHHVAACLNGLGSACAGLGDVKKALGYFEEALQIAKKVYGNEHPKVATCLNNLGCAWKALGDAKKAMEYLEEALKIGKVVYGDKHPSVATYLQNLGLTWLNLGDAKKAVDYLEEGLKIDKKVYGDEHPNVATGHSHLGTAWKALGDAKKAVGYLEEALKIHKKVYGVEHPKVVSDLEDLGDAWQDLGDAKKAVGYFEEALKIDKVVYGDEHPNVAACLNNLGLTWQDLGDAKKAVEYFEEALKIYKAVYGNEHPKMATCLNYLYLAWQDLGDARKAVGYLEKALKIHKKVYGDEHPNVAIYLNNLGLAWQGLADVKKAVGYYEEALKIGKKVYGDEHRFVAICLGNLGSVWHNLGDVNKAVGYYEEALKICRKVYNSEHPMISDLLDNLEIARKAAAEQ